MARFSGGGLQVLMGKLQARIEVKGRDAARAAGLVLEQQLKLELSQSGSGRVYHRGGVVHQASAPGEPPAPDTGQLRASVQSTHLPDGSVEIRVQAPYAVALEYGAPERRLEARPFFRPAIRKAEEPMRRAAEQAARESS